MKIFRKHMVMNNNRIFWFLIGWVTLVTSCSITPPYSEQALKNATDLKADSLTLLEKSEQSYSTYRNDAEEIEKQLRRAYEYSKGRPNNEEAVAQYEIMLDSNRRMLAGLLKRWKEKGTLGSQVAREESILNVSDGWDTIIALETGRQAPKNN